MQVPIMKRLIHIKPRSSQAWKVQKYKENDGPVSVLVNVDCKEESEVNIDNLVINMANQSLDVINLTSY